MDCKLKLDYSDDLLMNSIRRYREELSHLAEKYNYNFQHPIVLEASMMLDAILNLYNRHNNSKFIRVSDSEFS